MNFSELCADLRRLLSLTPESSTNTNQIERETTFECVPWSWLVKNLIILLLKYPSGLTKPIVLSELQQMWDEVSIEWQRGNSRKRQTINSIYDHLTIQTDAVLELWITSLKQPIGTKTTWIATLSDRVSEHHIEWYLHRRFFSLVTNPTSRIFQTGRLLRMTNCKLFDTSLSSGLQTILQMLPTEHLVIVLAPHELSLFQFETVPKTRRDVIEMFTQLKHSSTSSFFLMGKIRSKGKIESFYLSDGFTPSKKQKIFLSYPTHSLVPHSLSEPLHFCLVLEEQHLPLAQLFKKGDTLILENPSFDSKTFNESGECFYGSNTILYLLPMEQEKELFTVTSQRISESIHGNSSLLPSFVSSQSQVSQTFRVPIDKNGYLDVKYFPEQILVKDLKPKMTNISLLGRILHIQHNIPLIEGGKRRERFGVLLEDVEGTRVEITMWDSVGFQCARYRPGQLVFLTGVQSPETNPKEGKTNVTLNCAQTLKTEIFNISQLPALLTSPSLFSCVSLKEAKDRKFKNFICQAKICSFSPSNQQFIALFHTICKYSTIVPVKCDDPSLDQKCQRWTCQFCATEFLENKDSPNSQFTSSQLIKGYNVVWDICDGTTKLRVEGTFDANIEIVGLSPVEFEKLSPFRQQQVLQNTVQKEFVFSISLFSKVGEGKEGPFCYRIDQIAVPTNSKYHHKFIF